MKLKPDDVRRLFGELRDFKITCTMPDGRKSTIWKRTGRHWRKEGHRTRFVSDERLVKYIVDDAVVTEEWLRDFFAKTDFRDYVMES